MKAKNMYNTTPVVESDKGRGIHNQEKKDIRLHKVVTSHDEKDDSPKYKPNPDQNHKKFQCGTNPMEQDSFEKSLVMKEKRERQLARERYCEGIQGRDGGKKPYECYNENN
jgi:hypothetical protein